MGLTTFFGCYGS